MSEPVLPSGVVMRIAGYCPMGCGRTLGLAGMRVVCANGECPKPDAVDILLSNPEQHHLVDFREDGFVIAHPLRERVGEVAAVAGDEPLFRCDLNHRLGRMEGPPEKLGRYRIVEMPHAAGLGPNYMWEGPL